MKAVMNKPSRRNRSRQPKRTPQPPRREEWVCQTLTIARMGQRGEGVAEPGGSALFVPYTLPGETVRAQVAGNRAKLTQLLEPSPDRITPICEHFGVCGGCQVQHWLPDRYRAWKRQLVVDALKRQDLETEIEPLVDVHGAGRRRATLHYDGTGAGYRALRSHELVPFERCPVLAPELANAPQIARELGKIFGPCSVALTVANAGIDVAITPIKVRAMGAADATALAAIARRFAILRISLGGEILVQTDHVAFDIGTTSVALPPQSFLQATAAAEQALAAEVSEAVGKAKRVADLFCGLGPFALRLAEKTQVFAVDSDRAAVNALDAALKSTPGLKYLGTEVRDLFGDPLVASELARFEAIVFDPPRAGARAQAAELAQSAVKTIVAVSCDPVSFARDAAILVKGGYRLDRVVPFDQFTHTSHVELVARFSRPRR